VKLIRRGKRAGKKAEPPEPTTAFARVFLLSPANSSGLRSALLTRPQASFALALELKSETGATLADAFTFTSGLYFRGKRRYAERFAAPPPGVPAACVITPGQGLLPLDVRIKREDLLAFAQVPIDVHDRRYREPLVRDARLLLDHLGPQGRVVLLGSVASAKYTSILLEVFGDRLLFPPSFVGRGDMSRGGLLLRCARSGEELEYAPVLGAVVHGPRPPKLPRLHRDAYANDPKLAGVQGPKPERPRPSTSPGSPRSRRPGRSDR
jgi:hypothetical protein